VDRRSGVAAGLKRAVRRAAAPVGSVDAVRTREPEIVLTFDDGPDPVGTPAVLAALAAHGATATFFVLLTRVRQHPELLRRVAREGHEIALHGVDHQRLPGFSFAEARDRTAAGARELEALTGTGVRWFRPPYGAQTPRSWLATRRAGLVPVLWGPTTWDWRDVPQDERVRKAQQGARPGAVVLAHDAFAGAADGAVDDGRGLRPPDVDRFDLVDRVLAAYAGSGLRGRSLGDAVRHGRPVRVAHFST
jgi:peptidoglycan/xylan/chitin deacetylase (PgdA/CDA1 family)